MRLVKLRILGPVAVLALLFSFGLLTQASPAAAAGPASATKLQSQSTDDGGAVLIGIQDDSTFADSMTAYLWHPGTAEAMHVTEVMKLHHHWAPEDGSYCKIKGGGEVFVPEGSTPEAGLTC